MKIWMLYLWISKFPLNFGNHPYLDPHLGFFEEFVNTAGSGSG